jgi:hypothetical protein
MMTRASIRVGLFLGMLAGAAGCGGRVVVDHEGSTSTAGVGGAGGVGSPTSSSAPSSVGGSGGIATTSTSSATTSGTTGSTGGAGGSACGPVDDGNGCTIDACQDGVPIHTPTPAGTACSPDGAVCDGMGNCPDCISASVCAGQDTACQIRTCIAGQCGLSFTAAGTALPVQSPGDCQKLVCDGGGQIVNLADGADLPLDDGNACTGEACLGGAPTHPAKPNGSPCNDGDACTQTDTCQSGACAGQNPVVCAGTDVCTGGACVFACNWTPAPTPALPTAVSPNSVIGADLDGDGKVDLVVADSGGKVSVLLGNGNGSFAARVDYPSDAGSFAVAAMDLNGDGKPDLAVANSGGGTVSVLLNKGNGTFAPAALYPTGAGSTAVAALDLNGDGHPDLVVTNFNGSNLSVLINSGNGTFAAASYHGTGAGPSSIAALDLDGDGHADLAVADRGGAGGVRILLGSGTGTFSAGLDYPTGPGPDAIVALDLNGDGHPDLATANAGDPNNGTVSVLFGNGNGTFAAPVNYPTGLLPTSVSALDVNGDGKPDLAVAGQSPTSPGTGVVSVLQNQGNGVFGPRIDHPAGGNFISAAALDLNGDGHPDFAVTDYSSNQVIVLLEVCSP